MRLAFVYPPQEICPIAFTKKIYKHYSNVGAILPPLGIAYLAAILEKKHMVKVVEGNALRLNVNEVIAELRIFRPDILLFSMLTANFQSDLRWIKELKKHINAPIIVGGPQATLYPAEILTYHCIDFCVIGEGWETLPELIDCIETKGYFEGVKGIAYRKNGEVIVTGIRQSKVTINNVPFPSRHLLPNEKYSTILSKKRPITTMMSSEGCPFNCIYCSANPDVVFRDPLKVVDEMEQCTTKYGIREILFYDEIFSLDKKRAMVICEEILRRKLDISWSIRTRPDCVNESLIKLFAKAGCIRINYGFESGDPQILKILKRDIPIAIMRDAVRWTRKENIDAFGFFMIGSPGESKESIKKTIKLAKELDLDYVQFTKVTPSPHTELYRMVQEKIGGDFLRDYTLGKEDLENLKSVNLSISSDELIYWLKNAYQSFYFRPRYIVRTLMKVKSFKELKGIIGSACALI
ncbi:MAG: radical SAM protein [Candidatus Omnitrophica bacterium]|nr:radical SAM protein [Candidatus Omnitrophota bacterium]